MASFLSRLSVALRNAEAILINGFFGRPFSPEFALVQTRDLRPPTAKAPFSVKDIIGDGLLWAVPKTRRSVEKRLNRKFGWPKWVWKPIVKRTNLVACVTCGHFKEPRPVCPNCYKKIQLETNEIRAKILAELGLNPVEEDIIVLYEGESAEFPKEQWEGKRIIEMEKPRPAWFSKNLLQKTTQQSSTSTDIKPSELA